MLGGGSNTVSENVAQGQRRLSASSPARTCWPPTTTSSSGTRSAAARAASSSRATATRSLNNDAIGIDRARRRGRARHQHARQGQRLRRERGRHRRQRGDRHDRSRRTTPAGRSAPASRSASSRSTPSSATTPRAATAAPASRSRESSVLDQGTLVENNTADANGGDGIYVEGAGHTITSNVAQLNGGWGIYSVGAVDGGGNFAAGNMEPEQCFGVVCELGAVPGAPDTWIVSGPGGLGHRHAGHPEREPQRELHLHGRRRVQPDHRARLRVPHRLDEPDSPGRTASTRPST